MPSTAESKENVKSVIFCQFLRWKAIFLGVIVQHEILKDKSSCFAYVWKLTYSSVAIIVDFTMFPIESFWGIMLS